MIRVMRRHDLTNLKKDKYIDKDRDNAQVARNVEEGEEGGRG